ncbi:MAG: VacB/RNase II family 3'-5' exoribonuclease [Oxalobacteraceae bacterium]|nr:VacB/RNase II family 3'-5' exoribonuclease [Oxalobacteraceae bacterium]
MSQYPYSIPSREEILGILRKASDPQTSASIARALSVKESELDGLNRRLAAMERDGQIKPDRKGHIQLANTANFIEGRVSCHRDGYGFLIPDEGDDIFLPEKEMQKVLHGDRVQVRVTGVDRRGRPEGTIVEVLARANTHVIGRLMHENGVWIVVPEDKRIGHDILLTGGPGKARAGQVVSVELTEQPSRYTQPIGKIAEVLGEIDDPGMEIEIAVRKYGVPHEFSDDAKKLAAKLPSEVGPADLDDRVDLRDVPLVTIDGEDARDFDDAVYCEPIKLGRTKAYRLIVAIADVSHYVKPNDALDQDALERSTSVYFPRRVIPMLPEKLSNGLCSLNPEIDRLTLVCDAVITAKGEIKAYQFYPAVIHSAARLTYNEVAAILGNTRGPEAARRAPLLPHLQHLYGLYLVLLQARHQRGAIDFETTETYIVCNAAGKIEQIIPRTRNDAHRLIEECMLAANVCAADFMERHEHPGMYRIHAGPTEEKLNQLRTYDAYAHFTSPIRRYPDLLTHRAIKAILQGKRYHPRGIATEDLNLQLSPAARKMQAKDRAAGKRKAEGDLAIWESLGIHCSANERRADEASRDVEAWLKCYFVRDKLGEEFTGTISGVASFGIFVQLDALFIEGMVHVTELGADYFQYDEARHELRGERTGIRYQLTDRVTVQVSRVDLDARRIDLRLVHEPGIRTQLKNEARRADDMNARTGNFGAKKAAKKASKKKAAPAKPATAKARTAARAVKSGARTGRKKRK